MYAAKAIAALIGTILTALFAAQIIPVSGVWYVILTVASIVATAVTTYQVPNKAPDLPKIDTLKM